MIASLIWTGLEALPRLAIGTALLVTLSWSLVHLFYDLPALILKKSPSSPALSAAPIDALTRRPRARSLAAQRLLKADAAILGRSPALLEAERFLESLTPVDLLEPSAGPSLSEPPSLSEEPTEEIPYA